MKKALLILLFCQGVMISGGAQPKSDTSLRQLGRQVAQIDKRISVLDSNVRSLGVYGKYGISTIGDQLVQVTTKADSISHTVESIANPSYVDRGKDVWWNIVASWIYDLFKKENRPVYALKGISLVPVVLGICRWVVFPMQRRSKGKLTWRNKLGLFFKTYSLCALIIPLITILFLQPHNNELRDLADANREVNKLNHELALLNTDNLPALKKNLAQLQQHSDTIRLSTYTGMQELQDSLHALQRGMQTIASATYFSNRQTEALSRKIDTLARQTRADTQVSGVKLQGWQAFVLSTSWGILMIVLGIFCWEGIKELRRRI